jgi:hypothetical protein
MWKVATFIAVVTTMAVLGLLIFLVEKTRTGEEWGLMARWFRLCDWLLPNSRPASSHQRVRARTLREPAEVRKREPPAPVTLAAQR